MDEEIERLVVSVRADAQGFARDVAAMRAEMDGPFATGVDKAGRLLENSLTRAIQTGKFGFEDLRRIALSVLSEIASAAIRSGVDAIAGSGSGNGGLLTSLGSILTGLLGGGAPGRATGGPVSPGRAYRVGENGPELFVPTTAGRVENAARLAGSGVHVNLTVNVSDNGRGSAPEALQRSTRQMVRSLRRALSEVES